MLKWIAAGLLFFTAVSFAQNSPHGKQLRFDCNECHVSTTWKISYSQLKFNHSVTGFELTGKHKIAECRRCHQDLVFNRASNECKDCHSEPHQNTLGKDCAGCHTTSSWTPIDMMQKHNQFRFSLVGVHNIPDCQSCHSNAKNFIYSGASIECYSCHQKDYQNSTNPNHALMAMPTNCDQCHTLKSTGWTAEKFVHVTISLKGPHGGLKCNQCHTTPKTTQQCFDCHQKDFNAAKDPNHVLGNFDHNCLVCHNSDTWGGARFDHSTTKFPLTGAHQAVACSQCHTSSYAGTSSNCVSCHQNDYNKTTNPGHASLGMSTDCAKCHSSSGWIPSSFDHNATGFQLVGAHAKQQCSSCHKGTTTGLSTDCFSCHQNDFNKAGGHTAQNFPHECLQCHNMNSWDGATFDHSKTNFPLTGAHKSVSCKSCHPSGYQGTSKDCFSCHQNQYNRAERHVAQNYPHDCTQCHSTSSWERGGFQHTSTFPLTGAHQTTATCADCHQNGVFQGTPALCSSCHQTNYNNAQNPAHASAGISTDCAKCHDSKAWKPSGFSHSTTGFTLTGAHINQQCSSCHKGTTTGLKTDCFSCHQSDYSKAKDHAALGYPTTCDQCHSTTIWTGATFNHAATNFPLTGAHSTVTCVQCHSGGFKGTSMLCNSCHMNNFNTAANPNHQAAGISNYCAACHTTTAWKPSTFSHASTGFALTGAHINQQCSSCHKGTTTGLQSDCFSCHQKDYNRAENHLAQNFPHDCTQCHTTSKWDGANFNHSATNFPLTGAHSTVLCSKCHTSGYKGTPMDCQSCHKDSYNTAANPNHVAAGISTDCSKCHTSAAWIPSTFSHASTGFTLTGAHTKQQCSSCHKGTTAGMQADCFSCHQNDYNRAENHLAQGYPKNCEQCHNTNSWDGATFNHTATAFPLTGAHTVTSCMDCHSGGFKGTSTVCASCHQNNFNSTANPKHSALSIPNTCETCHTTNAGWKPAQFPNHNNYFVLSGAHTSKANDCYSCHKGNYSSTPNTCYGCHQSDFTNTSNPSHQTLGFSQDCTSCHTTTAWQPATYKNHDAQFFPIYSGSHRGRWNTCADCHTVTTNYKVFECINCHEHSQSSMDSKHRGNKNYVYKSTECYRCHPTGRGDLMQPSSEI